MTTTMMMMKLMVTITIVVVAITDASCVCQMPTMCALINVCIGACLVAPSAAGYVSNAYGRSFAQRGQVFNCQGLIDQLP